MGKFVPPQTFGPPNAEDAYANAREFFFSPETAGTGQQEHSHKKIEMGKDLVRLCHPASAGYSLGLVLVFMGKVNIPCGYVAVFEAVNHHRAPSLLASIHPADIRAFQEIETRCHTERPDYPSWTGHALQRWVPTWVQKEAQVGASRVLLYLPETWTKPGGSEEPTN